MASAVSIEAIGDVFPAKDNQNKFSRGTHPNIIQAGNTQYLCVRIKRFGVEPGFEAVPLDDQFFKTLATIDEIKLPLKANGTVDQVEFLKSLKHEATMNAIATIVNHDKRFNVWMFKQDYNDPDNSDKVKISAERYTEIKRPGEEGSAKSRAKANLSALKECIANDVSICFGIPTQMERLVISKYSNGKLKLMTACRIESNYQDLGEYFQLTGDIHDPNSKKGLFENYLVKKGEVAPTTQSPPVIGRSLPLHLLMEERDFVGAYGQNFGMVNGEPFKVDLGKAWPSAGEVLDQQATILDSLQDNGQFKQPYAGLGIDSVRRHVLHRNINLLYDVPFKENMIGFHMLNKMVNGITPSDVIVASYGMREALDRVKPNSLTAVFDEHTAKLQALLATEVDAQNKEELRALIAEVAKVKAAALANAEKILVKIGPRLKLTGPQVELLSNLEKLTSKATDLTNNKKVRTAHLQVRVENRIAWKMEVQANKTIFLNCHPQNDEALKLLHQFLVKNNLLGFVLMPPGKKSPTPEDFKKGIHVTAAGLDKLTAAITETAVKGFLIPLSDPKIAIGIAQGRLLKDFSRVDPKHAKKATTTDLAYYNQIMDKTTNTLSHLIYLKGFLRDDSKSSVKTEILAGLQTTSAQDAIARLDMLIVDQIRIAAPKSTSEEIMAFLAKTDEHLKDLNTKLDKDPKNALQPIEQIRDLVAVFKFPVPQEVPQMAPAVAPGQGPKPLEEEVKLPAPPKVH